MTISKVRVKNFRSLREVTIDAAPLTVFVGCNDEGKSNLLRALDLFFSSNTTSGYQFNWERDLCKHAKKISGKALQIEITLFIKLPDSFNVTTDIAWLRVWRQEGLHKEEIRLADGEALPPRSKAEAFLRAIRYDYVPAIKGPDYFSRLLSSVHDMLNSTVRADIRSAAMSFTGEIRRHTSGILSDLEEQLGLKSEIELPSDLRQLFSDLEFTSEIGSERIPLAQRGDGIKVRHIPIILRWLAEQANHQSAHGKPRTITIWGYEEPENNLEISRCFELAQYFLDTSRSIQTFLTTHSPVFYSVINDAHTDSTIKLFEVKNEPDVGSTLTVRTPENPDDMDLIHSSIGFLELLKPHIQAWKEKFHEVEKRIRSGLDTSKPTIFVEGPSDQKIFDAILAKHFSNLQKKVAVLCEDRHGGGHSWVKDSLIAWQYRRAGMPAVGVFDKDPEAGAQVSIQEFKTLVEDKNKNNPCAFKVVLKPAGLALRITQLGVSLPVALEELYPIEAWMHAKEKGWLERRRNLVSLYNFSEEDRSVSDWISDRVKDQNLRLIVTHRVKSSKKVALAKYVSRRIKEPTCALDIEPLRKTTERILKRLNLLQ